MEDTGIDGFNLAYVESTRTFKNIVELLVPELQKRGAYKAAYSPGTLREKLLGKGRDWPRPTQATSTASAGRER